MATIQEFPTSNKPDLVRDMRGSVMVQSIVMALAQTDAALQCRPMPTSLEELHHDKRQQYQNAALVALLGLNLDAEYWAVVTAENAGWEAFEKFCRTAGLDWCDDSHIINQFDQLEIAIDHVAKQAIKRYRDTLSGAYPGLSAHLARVQRMRDSGSNGGGL